MIVEMIAVFIGVMLVCAGAYYLVKEKHDAQSRKIYTITLVIGAVIAAGALIKMLLIG